MTSREYLQTEGCILVAPLDWGLGHAVRCLPLIAQLLADGKLVLLGGSDEQLAFLRKHYPQLPGVRLPAYRVRYPYRNMLANMLVQGPAIAYTAWKEHRVLQRLIRTHAIRAVLSDNRFGLFSRRIPCVYLTHQCHLPVRPACLQGVANTLHRLIMRQFTAVWIPDRPPPAQLAPLLSSRPASIPARYLGVLTTAGQEKRQKKVYQAIFVLSGPEPQRTRLETALLQQIGRLTGPCVLVRGTRTGPILSGPLPCRIIDLADRATILSLTAKSDVLVARAGYTTIMDLAVSGQKALLIPTPGQYEQEYLAEHLHRQGYCYAVTQDSIDLEADLQRAAAATGFPAATPDHSRLQAVLKEWYQLISC